MTKQHDSRRTIHGTKDTWQRTDLSIEAKGMLVYMVAAGRGFRLEDLCRALGIGRDKARRIVNELLDVGLAEHLVERKGGRIASASYFAKLDS